MLGFWVEGLRFGSRVGFWDVLGSGLRSTIFGRSFFFRVLCFVCWVYKGLKVFGFCVWGLRLRVSVRSAIECFVFRRRCCC